MSPRRTATAAEAGGFPKIATFVIGGAKGFLPYTDSNIASYIRDAGANRVETVAVGKDKHHAATIAVHRKLMNDVGDMRNACACAFYATGSTSPSVIVAFPL